MPRPDSRAIAPGDDAYRWAMDVLAAGDAARGAAALSVALRNGRIGDALAPDAYGNLGTALSMVGRNAEAVVAYRASIFARPTALTHYNLGIILTDTSQPAEAEVNFRAAVRLDPGLEGAYNNLGNLLAGLSRQHEAADAFYMAIHASPTHAMAYNNLANVLRSDGTGDTALRAAGRAYVMAVRLAPAYLEAYRNLGNLCKERSLWRRSAVRAYRMALSLLPTGTGAGGRQVFLNLGETLQWLGHHRAANVTFALAVERGVWQHAQQRPSHLVEGLRAVPWWRVADVPVVQHLLAPAPLRALIAEGRALLAGHRAAFRPYYSPALTEGNWTDVTLALSGTRQPGAVHAPQSYAYWESLGEDAVTMVTGSAYFSVLSPGARLRPHCGPTNVRLRVHIGLAVPNGATMRVGNESRPWREGEALVFDDSFEHEVRNEGASPRLVFIFDVWHPQLRTDTERLAALETDAARQRYLRAAASVREGRGLPEEGDLVAERRVRTIF